MTPNLCLVKCVPKFLTPNLIIFTYLSQSVRMQNTWPFRARTSILRVVLPYTRRRYYYRHLYRRYNHIDTFDVRDIWSNRPSLLAREQSTHPHSASQRPFLYFSPLWYLTDAFGRIRLFYAPSGGAGYHGADFAHANFRS